MAKVKDPNGPRMVDETNYTPWIVGAIVAVVVAVGIFMVSNSNTSTAGLTPTTSTSTTTGTGSTGQTPAQPPRR